MTLTVWLNRTFGTSVHTARALKDNPDGHPVRVLASHPDPRSPVLTAADAAFTEPHLTGDDYAAWALGFAQAHGVDVLWPTRHATALSRHADAFTAAGVHLLSSPAAAVTLAEDKAATYAHAAALGIPVPDHHVVTTATQFASAYADLTAAGHTVCFKPVTGVGGMGFRILTDQAPDFTSLMAYPSHRVYLGTVLDAMATAEPFAPLLVMPFLSRGETSVDTLSLDGQVALAVARRKAEGSRAITLSHDPVLGAYTETLVADLGLSYLSNVQFRFDEAGDPFLLEVNTRASGGLFQTCLGAGNLPWAAVRAALDGQVRLAGPVRLPVSLVTVSDAVTVHSKVAAPGLGVKVDSVADSAVSGDLVAA